MLVEKPMAHDRWMTQWPWSVPAGTLASSCGVGYHLRQHPGQRAVQRLIAQGVLGTVTLAQGASGASACVVRRGHRYVLACGSGGTTRNS